jgi:hypothetical protein
LAGNSRRYEEREKQIKAAGGLALSTLSRRNNNSYNINNNNNLRPFAFVD